MKELTEEAVISLKLPRPRYVVLACTCGAVKLKTVNTVIGARKMLQDYQKECGAKKG